MHENILNNTFFIGVVENRNDPLKLGRVQVRCLGYHTEDKNNIPTDDLPFAQVIQNSNNLNISPPKEGDWVLGIFLDGSRAQQPIVLGMLPGIPESTAKGSLGFNDPREDNGTISDAPKLVKSREYKDDGTGVEITDDEPKTNPQILQESSLSRILRNENTDETFLNDKKNNRIEDVKKAAYNTTNETWSEKENPYNAVYPYNMVLESESGHVVEIDDSKDSERLHVFHRTGTFYEIHPNGDQVVKIVGDNQEIILKNKEVYISGDSNITIQGNCNLRTEGDLTAEIVGDSNIYCQKKINMLADDDITITSNEKVYINGDQVRIND